MITLLIIFLIGFFVGRITKKNNRKMNQDDIDRSNNW